jgi:hypothetical protein
MGIEPTEPGFRRIPLDLKSRPATRPDSPPQSFGSNKSYHETHEKDEFNLFLTRGKLRVG